MVGTTGPYPVLRKEMREKKARAETLAVYTGRSVNSIRDKMAGRTEWSLDEAIAVQRGLQSDEKLEVLFGK